MELKLPLLELKLMLMEPKLILSKVCPLADLALAERQLQPEDTRT